MTTPHIDTTKTEEEDRIFRLHDMLVQEVSLVDRAANQRKFLLLKREESSMPAPTELTPDGNGGFVSVETGVAKDEVTPEADAQAGGDGDGEQTKDGEGDASVSKIEIDATVKQDVLRMLTEALESLMAIGQAVNEADEGGPEGALPVELVDGLKSVGGLLGGIAERYTGEVSEESSEDDAGDGAPAAESEEQVAARDNEATEKGEDDVLKALAHAANVLKPVQTAKAGRKMSKTRLDKLRETVRALNELLADVDPEPAEQATAKGPGKKKPMGTKADDGSTKKDAPAEVSKIAELQKSLDSLQATVKKDRATIARLEKNVGLPNSLPVESGGTAAPTGSGKVSWPMDMNAPVERDTVGKAHWFTSENK